MKKIYFTQIVLALTCFASFAQTIDKVYFAQTHVVEPDYIIPMANEKLKLISDRDALLKVHVIAPGNIPSPSVTALLDLNGSTTTVSLSGPATLPESFNSNLGQVNHNFNDSFTGVIPKAWMQPGLEITVNAGSQSQLYNNLSFSAPNKMLMTNFEVNVFFDQTSEYPTGWEAEFSEKFPTSELVVQNVRVLFEETAVPPTGGRIAARIGNTADYEAITGFAGFGSNSGPQNLTATEWKAALRDAAGLNYGNMRYTHVAWKFQNRANKGVGGGYSSVSRRGGNSLGLLLHEVGHALSLPHWGASTYPYIGDMHGIVASGVASGIHSGPIWMYHAPSQQFIPPYQASVTPLTYKNDPMNGGGNNLKEPGFLTNHFSDFSVNRMRNMLENHIVVYNETLGEYAKWDTNTMAYTSIRTNLGNVRYPVERNVQVISVIAAASSTTPQANIVYEPVGPYESGIIDIFDPNIATDRTNAASFFCPSSGCDTTLKIVQGGVTKYAMLRMDLDNTLDPTDPLSFKTKGVNLRHSDGEVTSVELLDTPNAEINGLPNNPVVLASWQKNLLSNSDVSDDTAFNIFKLNKTSLRLDGFSDLGQGELHLISMAGQIVFSKSFNVETTNNIDISIPNLSNGIYIARIKFGSTFHNKKIILY